VKVVVRAALLAYPKEFRTDFGAEYARTVDDLVTHGGRRGLNSALRIAVEALTVGPRMRWENLMSSTRIMLSAVVGFVALASLAAGSTATGILTASVIVLLLLQLAGRNRLIAPIEDVNPRSRWLRLVNPEATTTKESTVKHLRWLALPVLGLGLVFLFFGLIWTALPQLGVGVALVAVAASLWRVTAGVWPVVPEA
jgi:hypothetical protein